MASGRLKHSHRTTESGKQLDVHEYFFYTPERAIRFADLYTGLNTVQHSQLCSILTCSTSRQQQLFAVTIETEAVRATVEWETQRRRRVGLHWTLEEVVCLVKEVTSVLVHLAEKVRNRQNLCCVDLSGDNVVYEERTFKLRKWNKQGVTDFDGISPQQFSPEMKNCYVQWLSGQRVLPQVDTGKAAVYSLALLALSLLSPELTDSFFPSDQLDEVVRSVGTSVELTQCLQEMLESDPALRPSPAELAQLLASRLLPAPTELLSSLSRAISAADYTAACRELEKLWETGVAGKVHYPCSGCGIEIELGAGKRLIDVCEKHLFCSVSCLVNLASHYPTAADSECPVCTRNSQPTNPPKRRYIIKKPTASPQQTCLTCKRLFDIYTSGTWRQELPSKSARAGDYCSPECFPAVVTLSEPEEGSQVVNTLEGLNCYMRRLSWTVPLINDGLIEYFPDSFKEAVSTRTEQELSLMQTLLISCNPLCQCHFCGGQVDNLTTGRFILCGQERNFVCSCDCLRTSLGLQTLIKDAICTTCGNCVTASDIEVALGLGSRKCSWCTVYYTAESTSCGHQICNNCREGMGYCIACDFVRMKTECLGS